MKVVVAAASGPAEEYKAIVEAGHELVIGRTEEQRHLPQSEGELIELCQDAACLVSGSASRRLIEALPNLTTIVSPVIGYERVDVAAATEHDVLVCNSPSRENFTGVAEGAIALMLALAKRHKRKDARLRRGEWGQRSDRGFLLAGGTVGIVGLGRTGSGVARRLNGWEVKLLGYDPYVPAERIRELGVESVDLPTLLRDSDYVTVHVTVTPDNQGMLGEAQLRQMKPSAFLVNTSRGEALDEDAVCRAINENWIAGVALDVFRTEPLPADSPLRDLDPERAILTPHNACATEASRTGNQRMAIEGALTALRGEVPASAINPEVAPRWRGALMTNQQT